MKTTNLKIIAKSLAAAWFVTVVSLSTVSAQASKKFETRCGWFDNPTPGNYWLSDKDNEWIFGVQGSYQLEGFEFPKFKKNQWVNYFGRSYGYGCACFEMQVDRETKYVLQIRKSWAKPLSACRTDKALRKWKSLE